MGRKQHVARKIETEKDQKRMRIAYVFLGAAIVFILIGAAFLFLRELFYPDFTYVLWFELLGGAGLYLGALCFCAFFLYLCAVITFKNPHKVKRTKVVMIATFGVCLLVFCTWLVRFSSQEVITQSAAINDYHEGDWIVKELYVKDVYGPNMHTNLTALETDEGDLTLYWEPFTIQRGKTYQITYLEKTKIVLKIDVVDGAS
ncbi:hypothetical protein [Bacillus sp. PS06]|uniref:hypothetical protein n=1 Tax=Bacillus sp. PS06 TaxID=2764176 RepID=UPI001782EFD6|nr:hypothetical protein [Bacillus sp. PS06]MBD8069824.1 hypothetical protein [Bacillus sp. PS06]